MKKKSAFFATLSLAMATTAITAFASPSTTQEEVTPETSVVESQTPSPINNPFVEDHLISPMVIDTSNPIGDTVSGGAIVKKSFKINSGYGHIKLLMKNYSSKPVMVTLTHNATGLVYFVREIKANDQITWKNFEEGFGQGMRSGEYTLQWSGAGTPVNGEFFGKTGSSISDVRN
ncbi:pilus assembly protein [Paenibacillus sp. FSL W8-0194]|uniref:pilus assembly protein n=1 Tax=Paenibacillus sp. FSL W8-0194 TaxID=2921711 RepID=UPI0030DAD978